MPASAEIEPARPSELVPAFRLVFQHLSVKERETRVANALTLIEQGEFDPRGVLVARGRQGLLGAMICLPVPGASGLVWPPRAVGDDRVDLEDQLVRHASAWLRQNGARLAQSLLVPDEAPIAAPLLRNGFAHVTSLWYVRRDLEEPLPPFQEGPPLTYETYERCDRDLFHRTLFHTYQGTLDCPEVTDVRTVEETMEGHRVQGIHDPARWWLALLDGRPAGVLLLTETPEMDAWDVSYVGVLPELRGRGIGRQLMMKALLEARASETAQLTLSVDARNWPAGNLYRALGFERYDEREVFLAIWK